MWHAYGTPCICGMTGNIALHLKIGIWSYFEISSSTTVKLVETSQYPTHKVYKILQKDALGRARFVKMIREWFEKNKGFKPLRFAKCLKWDCKQSRRHFVSWFWIGITIRENLIAEISTTCKPLPIWRESSPNQQYEKIPEPLNPTTPSRTSHEHEFGSHPPPRTLMLSTRWWSPECLLWNHANKASAAAKANLKITLGVQATLFTSDRFTSNHNTYFRENW